MRVSGCPHLDVSQGIQVNTTVVLVPKRHCTRVQIRVTVRVKSWLGMWDGIMIQVWIRFRVRIRHGLRFSNVIRPATSTEYGEG